MKRYKKRARTYMKYGTKTKWQNLGVEPHDLDIKYIDTLRLQKEIGQLKKILGPQLFIEWLYHSGIISFKEYQKIRPTAINANETEIDYSILVDIECD